MSKPGPDDSAPTAARPRLSARGEQAAAERFERAAAALRANLKRRKAQRRARGGDPSPEAPADTSAAIPGPAEPALPRRR